MGDVLDVPLVDPSCLGLGSSTLFPVKHLTLWRGLIPASGQPFTPRNTVGPEYIVPKLIRSSPGSYRV